MDDVQKFTLYINRWRDSKGRPRGTWYVQIYYHVEEEKRRAQQSLGLPALQGAKRINVREAKQLAAQFTEALVRSAAFHSPDSIPTLGAFSHDIYLPRLRVDRSAKWCQVVGWFFEHYLVSLTGTRLDRINETDIKRVITEIATKTSANTANKVLSTIRCCLEEARELKYIETNPAVGVKRLRVKKKVPVYYNEQEVAAILAEVRRRDEQAYHELVLIYLLALRRDDFRRLTRRHFRLDDEPAVLVIEHTKRGVPRILPLGGHALESARWLVKKGKFAKGSYSFPNRRNLLNSVARALKLPSGGTRAFRHSGATAWARKGATSFEVQTLLGHSTPYMSAQYLHLAGQDLARLIEGQMLPGAARRSPAEKKKPDYRA